MSDETQQEANLEAKSVVVADDTPVRPAIYVRVSAEEYRSIAGDAKQTGESLPDLLKRSYFSNRTRVTILMTKDDLKVVLGQLGRIGNNLNQIAKAMNTGFREGFNDDFLGIRRSFDALMVFMTARFKNSLSAK